MTVLMLLILSGVPMASAEPPTTAPAAPACYHPADVGPSTGSTGDTGPTPSCRRWIGVLKEHPGRGRGRGHRGRKGSFGKPTSKCPKGWQWLFGDTGKPPPGLQRYCYAEGPDPRTGEAAKAFESIHCDCRVVGPAAKSFFDGYFWPLRKRFVREARGVDAPPTPNRTRLVIVDSVRDDAERPELDECASRSLGDDECSPHGWALANLAKDLLCDPGRTSCEADIGSRRVLRWTYGIRRQDDPVREREMGITEPGGGFYGSWRDLALAIRREVADWWADPDRKNLVLNLSVGWESVYGDDVPEVRAAIEDAVCRGALVVAAAGNRQAGPEALETPLLPAAWEQLPAPGFPRCRALIGERPPRSPAAKAGYRPLLFAVGGVRHGNRVLPNARPKATPRLVAFADHAAALFPSSPPRSAEPPAGERSETEALGTLTGTSVSTLVVSAAAAVSWNRRPESSPFEVMDRLWKAHAAHTVNRKIDFCWRPEENCPDGEKPRRIYLHPPAADPSPPWPGDERPTVDTTTPEYREATSRSLFPKLAAVDGCDPAVLAYDGELSPEANLCPQRSLLDVAAQPWLGPQPGSDHNPDCTLGESSPGTLVLEFDPCFRIEGAPATLDDLTLVVDEKAFRLPKKAFTLGEPTHACPSPPGKDDPRRVQLVLKDLPFENPESIFLVATVNKEYAVVTPILHVRHD